MLQICIGQLITQNVLPSSWRESTVSAVQLHTERMWADEDRKWPSIILIKCMFVFALLGLFVLFFILFLLAC